MKKKIVIIGGLGYIGTELCKIYSGESWHNSVVAIDSRFVSERVNQLRDWKIDFRQGGLLDKDFLINEIGKSKAKIIDDKYYTFSINKKNQKINIFFKKEDLSLIGWQTEDIYQNLSVTFIYNIKLNKNIDENVFKLPKTF